MVPDQLLEVLDFCDGVQLVAQEVVFMMLEIGRKAVEAAKQG